MGRRGGEMESPLRRMAQRALLLPISEAEPRSVDRIRGLSWFAVPENRRMKVGMTRKTNNRSHATQPDSGKEDEPWISWIWT